LQNLSKFDTRGHVHYICIDKRVKEGNKMYVILESGERIVMPNTITKVPALLLLNQGYNILYGNEIPNFFKPIQKEEVKQATLNNIDPLAFSFNGGVGSVVSDQFSFLDMDSDALSAKGEGGIRQLHNYVSTTGDDSISTPEDETSYKSETLSSDMSIEKLQQERESDLTNMQGSKKMVI
tara:strand:+ start:2181 stop:2720 length:540 start_codon:yes stop_codon:yes gene_type:complete